MSNKKKKSGQHQPLSPKKYIIIRARLLPIYKCLISKEWNTSKLASLIITRRHTNGHITAGFYLVDMLARGVKDTHYVFNEPEDVFFGRLNEQGADLMEEISYPLAHNIVYGAVEFAEEHNFQQHPDFRITEYILEEDDEKIEIIDLEFGIGGKPVIMDAVVPEE